MYNYNATKSYVTKYYEIKLKLNVFQFYIKYLIDFPIYKYDF